MSRPISWLPRIHLLIKSVRNSKRPHYERRHIEELFNLRTRPAQNLLAMLPTSQVGRSQIVEREALLAFLERIDASEDPRAELECIRSQPSKIKTKRTVNSLIQPTDIPATVETLPRNLEITPGRLDIQFDTIEQLAQTLYALSQVLDGDLDTFIRLYEPPREPVTDSDGLDDYRKLMQELVDLEKARASV